MRGRLARRSARYRADTRVRAAASPAPGPGSREGRGGIAAVAAGAKHGVSPATSPAGTGMRGADYWKPCEEKPRYKP